MSIVSDVHNNLANDIKQTTNRLNQLILQAFDSGLEVSVDTDTRGSLQIPFLTVKIKKEV